MSLIKRNEMHLFPWFGSIGVDFFGDDFFSLHPDFGKYPAANIEEDQKSFCINLAIPGMEKEDLVVEIKNGLLVVSAEKEASQEESEKKYTRKEYSYNSFRRTFSLPGTVKEDDIVAEYKNGVLSLNLPKTKIELPTAKKIKVF